MSVKRKLISVVARSRRWIRRHVPPGFRWAVGLLLIAAGFLGFLPVLGFWMIPVGVAVAAMDIGPLWRRFDKRHDIHNND